nr:hypothetical protein [Akkermansiaceae bacterium]
MRTFPLLLNLFMTAVVSLHAADLSSKPLQTPKPAPAGAPRFQSIPPASSGIGFTCPIDLKHP